jgi:hypothetical protein
MSGFGAILLMDKVLSSNSKKSRAIFRLLLQNLLPILTGFYITWSVLEANTS